MDHVRIANAMRRLFEHLPNPELVRFFHSQYVKLYTAALLDSAPPRISFRLEDHKYLGLLDFLRVIPPNELGFYLQLMRRADYIFNEEDRALWNEAISALEDVIFQLYTGLPKKEGD
jgi:hypothetical protein